MTPVEPVTYGDFTDDAAPLALLVHGFPDTPYTWRYLGPALAEYGYRVAAMWLPGYGAPVSGPIGVGTYVRAILDTRNAHGGDERTLLIGHDWGANAGYGAVAFQPDAFDRFVSLAIPPIAALGAGMFGFEQLRRSFYLWFIQQVGMAEMAFLEAGFWESMWAAWSPGYRPDDDVAFLRRHVCASNIANVVAPYRASFQRDFADPATDAEAAATMTPAPVPTLYLHGSQDGAIGAELVAGAAEHLPAPGSEFDIIDGVGHFLHLEQPDAVWDKIRAFLAR